MNLAPLGLARLRDGARRVAYVASIAPDYADLSEEMIVRVACRLAEAPECFVPTTEAREMILATYRDHLAGLGGPAPS